jgi:CelD/BcsL family acetyltransferase involved in cellulose biosynthesis
MSFINVPFVAHGAVEAIAAARDVASDLDGITITVTDRIETVAAEWKTLEAQAALPFCDFAWCRAWYDAHRVDRSALPVIALGTDASGEPLFLLPLALERRGPFRVLVWPGGTHSAYQCGLFSESCRRLVTEENAKLFWSKIFERLPRTDALAGYGLPQFELERGNPLAHLPSSKCGCFSYNMALSDDWETLYGSKVTSKKRSNDRRCERRMAELGSLRFRIAVTAAERRGLLDVLMAQKAKRFDELGTPNIFDAPDVRAFYRHLIDGRDWHHDRSVFLSAIQLEGEVIAVNLGLTQGKSFHGLLLSMASGDIERFGPGRMLLRRSMEHLCRHGFTQFDFGVGEDPYKDLWFDEAVERRDVLVPFSLKGRVFIAGLSMFLKSKAAIKQTPVLWNVFSRLRRYVGC